MKVICRGDETDVGDPHRQDCFPSIVQFQSWSTHICLQKKVLSFHRLKGCNVSQLLQTKPKKTSHWDLKEELG